MQLKDQVKRNWKVVTAVTTVSAIGITGLALADPGSEGANPDPIRLSDRTEITQMTQVTNTTIPGVSFGTIDLNNDSPFDSIATTSPPDDPATASPAAASPATASSAESPDTASVDSP